jgi:outer membrane protein assembly factor BamD
MVKKLVLSVVVSMIFIGCSRKKDDVNAEFNKPADYWYSKMIKYIKRSDLDKADDAYTSLESEHIGSPLVKEALMILQKAHRKEREYVMSKFYIDRYTKRFANANNIEYLRFLRIKTNFLTFTRANRDQKLLQDTIKDALKYKERFPNSPYNPYVDTMLTKLYLAELMLNKEIADLYRRTGKLKAAKIYEERINKSWLKNTKIKEKKSFLKQIF